MDFVLINLTSNSFFENNYLENLLLKNLNYTSINREDLDIKKLKEEDKKIIVSFSGGNKNDTDLLKQILLDKEVYCLIHFSDESLNHDYSIYKNVKKILRGYFNPKLGRSVLTIPIGFHQHDFNFRFKNQNEKKFLWTFMGSLKNERVLMNKKFSSLTPNFVNVNSSFMSDDKLSSKDYYEVLNNSLFALCPKGYTNFETFRIMEALEAKSIPIIIRSKYYDFTKIIYGNKNPLLTFSNWQKAYDYVNNFLEKPEEIDRYSKELNEWYVDFKYNLQNKTYLYLKNDFDKNPNQITYIFQFYIYLIEAFKRIKHKYFI